MLILFFKLDGNDSFLYYTFNFSPCQALSCILISIVDDAIPEYNESFTLSLSRPPDLPSWIGVSSEIQVIDIIDDDGKFSRVSKLLNKES